MGAARLAVAAALVLATAYVLSWQLLWMGMAGSEAPFHLHLINWVASTFPNLPWWYPWDAMGVSYREGYPLAAHWTAVALSFGFATNVEGGGQIVQFLVMPLTALGLYCFFDWRLRRRLAGLAAAFLFLLSPMGWVEMTHFGLYASWAGMVFFVPALIALDTFFFAWLAGERGWRFRLSAVAYIGLTTALGVVSPHLLAAPLVVAPAYALALPRASAGRALRWVLAIVPTLFVGILLLSLFWLGAELQYLSVVRSHWAGPGTAYDPGRLTAFSLGQLLSLHPIRTGTGDDLYSLSPAVTLPALLSLPLIRSEGRVRLWWGLGLVSLLFMADRDLFAPFFVLPGFKEFGVVVHRPLQLLLTVLAPALAALGIFETSALLARAAAGGGRSTVRAGVAIALPAALMLVLGADVVAFAGWVGAPDRLAYGPAWPKAADVRDLWQRHPGDACAMPSLEWSALCADGRLTSTFSLPQLVDACGGQAAARSVAPVCGGLNLGDPHAYGWSGDEALIAQTQAWCQAHADPACDAMYTPLASQLFDPGQWRPPGIGCELTCPAAKQDLAALGAIFPTPPQRAELNSNIGPLDMAFHDLVRGGITHSYNDQVIPSRELASWLEDNMLTRSGTTVKTQLAQALGIDAVVLSPAQAGQVADYAQMGWDQVNSHPIALVNPSPSGLAAEWAGGSAVLVVGATQTSTPELYNSVFKNATSGMLPFSSAWLVRGASPYIDDYSPSELSRYAGIIMLGYRYHDAGAAWSRVDSFTRGGGSVFVETGWQYVDPDWNAGAAPGSLPVTSLTWGALDPAAPVTVEGGPETRLGPFTYAGGGWGASSSRALRPGAEELVRVGDRIVVARWQLGKGRLVWSGMNLLAHADSSQLASEQQFVASQFGWLFPAATPQLPVAPQWIGDGRASLQLPASAGRTIVLFKESLFPGWSAQLVTPSGSVPVPLVDSEMDFMLVMLESVPAGASLVFTYGPTAYEEGTWVVSGAALLAISLWLVRPQLYARTWAGFAAASARGAGRLAGRFDRWGGDEEAR